MEKKFIYKNVVLSFSIWGSGSKAILSFHGFGQTKNSFRPLEQVFEEYTFYNFDLFFHGQSVWDEKKDLLTKDFWTELIYAFLKAHNINTFSLIGYSMGGKFVLAILEKFPNRIEKITFIAPDGIKINFWYRFATYPSVIRFLFKKTIYSPFLFKGLARLARGLKLVDKSLLKFAETQMDTREKRERVYFSWVVFRNLRFNMKDIAVLINKHEIKLEVFLGQYDKMITRKNVQILLSEVKDFNIEILESGHNNLISEVAKYYKKKGP